MTIALIEKLRLLDPPWEYDSYDHGYSVAFPNIPEHYAFRVKFEREANLSPGKQTAIMDQLTAAPVMLNVLEALYKWWTETPGFQNGDDENALVVRWFVEPQLRKHKIAQQLGHPVGNNERPDQSARIHDGVGFPELDDGFDRFELNEL